MDDTITLVSTTDTKAEVLAALTGKPVEETPAEPPAEPEPAPTPPAPEPAPEPEAAAPPADETPEQQEQREASDAGRALNKRKNKIQEQIDELTGRKYAARRDVEAEEARLFELRRQRQDIEAATPKPAAPTPAPVEAKPATPGGRPEPKVDSVDDKGNAKYATYEDYLGDHATWTKEEAVREAKALVESDKLAERARIEHDSATRAVNERLATYTSNLEAFKKTHADFDAAFDEAREECRETMIALGPTALKVIDGFTVFDAADGPALTYYLLKHPDELKAIATKPPQAQIVQLARLDERLRTSAAPKTGPSLAAVTETKAPAPIKPVGSVPSASTGMSDDETYQDYKMRRERELRARYAR